MKGILELPKGSVMKVIIPTDSVFITYCILELKAKISMNMTDVLVQGRKLYQLQWYLNSKHPCQ